MELELALAKKELNELIAESTAQSDTYFDAVKEVEKAEEDLAQALKTKRRLVKNRFKLRRI